MEPIVEEGFAEPADNQETERRIVKPETLSMSQSAPGATLLMRARKKPIQVSLIKNPLDIVIVPS